MSVKGSEKIKPKDVSKNKLEASVKKINEEEAIDTSDHASKELSLLSTVWFLRLNLDVSAFMPKQLYLKLK